MHSPYADRDRILTELGFRDYQAYLGSDLWVTIRERLYAETRSCHGCGKFATQIHHREYTRENLSGISLLGLVRLCGRCHRSIEHRNGQKCTLQEANAALDYLAARRIGGGKGSPEAKAAVKRLREVRRRTKAGRAARRRLAAGVYRRA